LVQAALHVMFHVTQTKWQEGYAKLSTEYRAAVTDADTYRNERDEVKDKGLKDLQQSQNLLAIAKDNEKKAQDQIADLNKKMAELRGAQDKADANLAGSQTGNERRQEEVKAMEATLKVRDDRIRDLVDSNNQLRDRAVAAEIESKSLKDRNVLLVAKVEEMAKENVKIKAGINTGVGMTAKNPPPENVEGLITKADSSGLVRLSIGSDAGLLKGHTLEVFRLSPAKYLGTVRVIEVTPHEAVAQPVSRPLGNIQQGDRVASKILGS
jgi:chromosome segregation ATPase